MTIDPRRALQALLALVGAAVLAIFAGQSIDRGLESHGFHANPAPTVSYGSLARERMECIEEAIARTGDADYAQAACPSVLP